MFRLGMGWCGCGVESVPCCGDLERCSESTEKLASLLRFGLLLASGVKSADVAAEVASGDAARGPAEAPLGNEMVPTVSGFRTAAACERNDVNSDGSRLASIEGSSHAVEPGSECVMGTESPSVPSEDESVSASRSVSASVTGGLPRWPRLGLMFGCASKTRTTAAAPLRHARNSGVGLPSLHETPGCCSRRSTMLAWPRSAAAPSGVELVARVVCSGSLTRMPGCDSRKSTTVHGKFNE